MLSWHFCDLLMQGAGRPVATSLHTITMPQLFTLYTPNPEVRHTQIGPALCQLGSVLFAYSCLHRLICLCLRRGLGHGLWEYVAAS